MTGHAAPRPAAFLDRDGVLTRSDVRGGRPYAVRSLAELVVLHGAADQVARLRDHGYVIVVVTNQPDVGRGVVAADTLQSMHDRLRQELGIDEIEVCTCGEGCRRYKPAPGMLLDAADRLGLDLARSWMVGDRWRDIGAGRAAGVRTILLDRGYNEAVRDEPDVVVSTLREAVDCMVRRS